ncbi:MAG: M20/M25/M40 family metallo-hydrolase [Gammaproteobacteria bacterium]|nr:M20/M25/M40 family metallo-hydrolase [Gammaproteobacteria bacterium]
MSHVRAGIFLLFLLSGNYGKAEMLSAERIRELTAANVRPALRLYRDFLSQPNDAVYPDDILRLVEWMEPVFAARGFQTRRLATAGSPVLFAQLSNPAATRTVLVYLQADGQPVDRSAWNQRDPYEPVLKARATDGSWESIPWASLEQGIDPDWRVFARSASDSKGPMTQFLLAMDVLAQANVAPAFNLKVIVDTEEELGSPNLADAVNRYRDILASDLLLIFDGPPHASNRPTVTFGARGIATITLTTFGPRTPQHSGHYGNFIPNPAFHLARILASMKDAGGRVLIPGFYVGVDINDALRRRLDAVPDDEGAILSSIGVSAPDKVAGNLQESLQFPSLNIRGLSSGWVGKESRTIIPATATAEIDIRLVVESDPAHLIDLVRAHIKGLGYEVIVSEPSDAQRRQYAQIVRFDSEISYAAFRSDFDSAPGRLARAGMRNLYGEEPILIRTMGGSIPISPFVETLGIPAAIVPTVNIDNNQHSPNENLRIGNFIEGIAILASVLSRELD